MIDIRILVLPRGWVVVGEYSTTGDEIKLTKAMNLRRWGTSAGLGELINGPLDETIMDPMGVVRTHRLTVLLDIQCNPEKWVAALK